jgi:hypothetical protein
MGGEHFVISKGTLVFLHPEFVIGENMVQISTGADMAVAVHTGRGRVRNPKCLLRECERRAGKVQASSWLDTARGELKAERNVPWKRVIGTLLIKPVPRMLAIHE